MLDAMHWEREMVSYPETFISSQPALVELSASAMDMFLDDYDVTSATLKALDITPYEEHPPSLHCGREFRSLKILRINISRADELEDDWPQFANDLPRLRCIEICQHLTVNRDGYGHEHQSFFGDDFLKRIRKRKNIREYHFIYHYYRDSSLHRGSPEFGYSQDRCTSTKSLVIHSFLPRDFVGTDRPLL